VHGRLRPLDASPHDLFDGKTPGSFLPKRRERVEEMLSGCREMGRLSGGPVGFGLARWSVAADPIRSHWYNRTFSRN